MPTDINRLQSLVTESAGDIAVKYASDPARFVREMERIITRAHTAAVVAGIGDRTRIAPKGLSKAERSDLNAAILAQRPYLMKFAEEMRAGNLSEDAIRRRAELYAGPVRLTYSKTRFPSAPDWPGSGNTPCLAWCRCSWQEKDGQLYWTLGASEHCSGCLTRSSEWAPYKGAD